MEAEQKLQMMINRWRVRLGEILLLEIVALYENDTRALDRLVKQRVTAFTQLEKLYKRLGTV